MALKKCKECGQEVSTKADKCPNCGAPVKRKGIGCGGALIIVILFLVAVPVIISQFTTYREKKKLPKSKSTDYPTTLTNPDKYDGAIFSDGKGRNFLVVRLLTGKPELYAILRDALGTEYSFLTLMIDNTDGKETMDWHCWTHKITIHLKDGVKLESLDLTGDFDLYSKLNPELREYFTCTKSVFPGKTAPLFLVFPAFSWKKVEKIHFSTGLASSGFAHFTRLE